jgi:RND family efflux transporter MFP subunit
MRTFILVSAISLLSIACSTEQVEQKEVLRPVRYITLGNANSNMLRSFGGDVRATKKIELSFRSSGVITILNIKVGQRVTKGQLLATLDNVEAKLSYDQAESAFKTAGVSLSNSRVQLDRIRSLYEKGTNSLADYEQAKIAYQQSLDQYESAKSNLDIRKSQIEYGKIYAPTNGVIAEKNVSINETASSGQIIAVINAGNELNVEVGIPENVINRISIGMPVELTFSSFGDHRYLGTITEIAPVVDPNTNTYLVKVGVNESLSKLKQGMSARVHFDFTSNGETEVQEHIIVPYNSVGEDGNGNFVFRLDSIESASATAIKQYVTVGELTNTGFEIEQGLEEGQLVVTAGINSLLNGQRVKL